jgi:hypothetical protein
MKEGPDMKVFYGKKPVGDVDVFYREGGRTDAPVILLLHGFPTSGHVFRNLMPALADRYRVTSAIRHSIAPGSIRSGLDVGPLFINVSRQFTRFDSF